MKRRLDVWIPFPARRAAGDDKGGSRVDPSPSGGGWPRVSEVGWGHRGVGRSPGQHVLPHCDWVSVRWPPPGACGATLP